MPNLNLISGLRLKYTGNDDLIKGFDPDLLNESFRQDKTIGISGFDDEFSHFDAEKTITVKSVFENREKVDVALLFIDMVNFSSRFELLESEELSVILDSYYDLVIPLIYKYGGEVEKLIGDGIICVFGYPFLNSDIVSLIKRAENCALEIIEKTFENDQSTKIAIHSGEIMYYKPLTSDFKEFTMIGKTLTELFRLESVSIPNSINYYSESLYHSLSLDRNLPLVTPLTRNRFKWINHFNASGINLSGVHYRKMGYLQFNSNFIP